MPELTRRQCDIIGALATANMNIAEAARITGCQRSTVIGHIERIENRTGLNPTNFFDLHELYRLTGR